MAYIGGIHVQEMNLLEREFLKFLDWQLWVDPKDYDCYMQGVIQHYTEHKHRSSQSGDDTDMAAADGEEGTVATGAYSDASQ